MTIESGRSLYREVYESLREEITSGKHPIGDRLPSEQELKARFGVSTITVKRSLDLLRADGLVIRRPRLGTVVTNDVARTVPPATGQPLVGCVLPNFDDTFGTHVLGGLVDASSMTASIILKRSMGDRSVEDKLVRDLVSVGMRALILQPSSSQFAPPSVLELVTRHFPVVILDRSFEGVPVSSVSSDNVEAAKLATDHLFSLGHTQVGLVSSSSPVTTNADRHEGFLHAHAEFHVPHDPASDLRTLQSTTPGSTASSSEDIEQLGLHLSAHPELTGFVATEYSIAVLLYEACQRLGRDVPRDLSIICFDHPDPFPSSMFHFTHMQQDQMRMGACALECALAQIGEPESIKKISLPTQLVAGGSTARPEQLKRADVRTRQRAAIR